MDDDVFNAIEEISESEKGCTTAKNRAALKELKAKKELERASLPKKQLQLSS